MSQLSADERQQLLDAQRDLIRMVQQADAPSPKPAGLWVYRKLIRATMEEAIENQLERTAEVLGPRFSMDIERFCNEVMPRSPIVRDIAYEFAVWVSPAWTSDPTVRAYVPDLARYELLCFDVLTAPNTTAVNEQLEAPIDPARSLHFHPSTRIGSFTYPVHEAEPIEGQHGEPQALATRVLAYRDEDNELRQLVLSPFTATLLACLLLEGEPLGSCIQTTCSTQKQALNKELLESIAELLADLRTRGALLGARSKNDITEPPSPWRGWLYEGKKQR